MTKPYKCRVEYLESTGTQYIDTGVVFSNSSHTYKWDIGAQAVNTGDTNYNWFCGLFEGGANSAGTYADTTTNYRFYTVGTYYQNGQVITSPLTNGDKYGIIRNVFTITNFAGTLPIILFGRNQSNGVKCEATKKIFYYKIYDNDVLVRDFIPVLDNSGRPAMYDQVSGQLFYNQGSGEFTYGRQIIPVEYLESTGTQYIDTGYAFTDNFTWEITFDGITPGATLFGGRTSSNRTALLYQRNYGGIDLTTCPIAGYNGQQTPFQLDNLETGKHTIKMTVASNKGSVWQDGVKKYSDEAFTGAYISGTTQALFADNFGSSISEYTSSKVYGLKMWQDSTLVRDFIPCIDENLVPFMFDMVNNTVYLNAGTGQFKVGPNMEKTWCGKKLRRKLALILANLKKKRPYYCEVEYIQSSGTQYIDTGFPFKSSTDEIEMNYTVAIATSGFTWGFGSLESGATYGMSIVDGSSSSQSRFSFNGTTSNFPLSDQMGSVHKITLNSDGIYNDGELKRQSYSSIIDGTWNNYLFALSYQADGTASYFCRIKIYNYKHKRNGILIRDMIPVLDWNYVPCMYDKVTEQLFYNAGTGDFSYGREIHYVDYLESDGTQYIDTGFKPNPNKLKFEFSFMPTSITGNHFAFGCRPDTTAGPSSCTAYQSYATLRQDWAGSSGYFTTSLTTTDKFLYTAENNVISLNDETYTGSTQKTDSYLTYNFMLFTVNTNGTVDNRLLEAKVYYAKLWDDGTLVRDFLPAIDENGVGFLFDKVTHSCFLNAGTGVFKYPARETEYIEVTDLGTTNQNPCIDLGLKYKSSMSIEAKYTRTGMGVSGSILPLSNSTTSPLIYMPALNASSKNDRFVWRRPPLPESSYYYDFEDYPLTIEFKVDAVNDALTINGNVAKTGMIAAMNGYESPYESSSNLYMLSINGTYGGMGKVYYVKLYDTTQVYRDLVPVWKDGVACIYDKQNNVYYSNTKTGTVICGKIIEPEYE